MSQCTRSAHENGHLHEARLRILARRKGRYVSETFLRREDARQWATDAERQVDRGGTPTPSRVKRLQTFGDLINLHIADVKEVGKPPGRSKEATLAMLKRELGTLKWPSWTASGW